MGAWTSVFKANDDTEDDEKTIKKYEEHVESDPYGFGLAESDEGKEIKWWQRLIFDMRFRTAYALAIAIFVGIFIPIIIYFSFFNKTDSTIYGSCLLKEEARFQCLINNAELANETSCLDAFCCWEENRDLQFQCFHSFPSAYQYQVSGVKLLNDGSNGQTGVQLEIQPNHAELMTELKVLLQWIGDSHLNLKLFNPKDYPEMTGTISSGGNVARQEEFIDHGLLINYGEEDGYFFIRLGRNETNETIFDTRLGPINSGKEFISLTTVLPSPFFYGLKGGEGIASKGTISYGVVNGFENAELPFYMSLDNSNRWHGVLLETTYPHVVQVIPAPGIMFHVEGTAPQIDLHFFVGPQKEDVLKQLHEYITTKADISHPPYIPPFWGLGLHLCHKSDNGSQALEHITALNEITETSTSVFRKIPYDSDCVDEDLLKPFAVDSVNFENLPEIIDYLVTNATKKIVIFQKVAMAWNETEIESVREFLVMDHRNTSNIKPYAGLIDNHTVYYPDVFNPNFLQDLPLWGLDWTSIPFSGLVLGDNFPINENPRESCNKGESFLQTLFLNSSSLTSAIRNGTWGSICPNMIHSLHLDKKGNKESLAEISTQEKAHRELHNVYGAEGLKKFRELAMSQHKDRADDDEKVVISTVSGWTESLYYGSHNGMEVGFTWIGLRESLAHILRNFILSPISATPICGSYLPNQVTSPDWDLCLRWYQLGLLLPFAYHSYGHKNVSRGPLDLPQSHQGYLRQSILQRYQFSPYYYSLLVEYQMTFLPPVTPLSYHFHLNGNTRNTLFALVDQFMIGKAVLAAPIVNPVNERKTYFPPGLWYAMDGYLAWEDTNNGGEKDVRGTLQETPLFLRGGHIIPALQNPTGNSITESRKENYTLIAALIPNSVSTGVLYMDDDKASNHTRNRIDFKTTNFMDDTRLELNFTIRAETSFCGLAKESVSTTIVQINLYGFPLIYSKVDIIIGNTAIEDYILGDEIPSLRMNNLLLNWCQQSDVMILVTGSAKS